MGNRVCGGRRWPVEERLTRPQHLVRQPPDVDYRKLRRLIRSRRLAPCFDALDERHPADGDLEECPICFLYYPSLNRSKCCGKRICTECFLQLMPLETSRPVHCYAVEYRGARTAEERYIELAEEQKVIEVKLRKLHETQTGECVDCGLSILEVQHPFPSTCGNSRGLGDSSDFSNLRALLLQNYTNADASSTSNAYRLRSYKVPSNFFRLLSCLLRPIISMKRHDDSAVDFEHIDVADIILQSLPLPSASVIKDSALHGGSTTGTTCMPSGSSSRARFEGEIGDATMLV